jgi:hypothetical protein
MLASFKRRHLRDKL